VYDVCIQNLNDDNLNFRQVERFRKRRAPEADDAFIMNRKYQADVSIMRSINLEMVVEERQKVGLGG